MHTKDQLPVMKERSDEELLQLFESGRIEAFNEIVMRYKDSLYNYLKKFTGGSPDCKDIVQEAFIQLYEYQKRTRDIKNFRAWIFRITINKAKKKFMLSSRLQVSSFDDYEDHESYLNKYHAGEFTEEITEFDEGKAPLEVLQEALDELDGASRSAVLLRYDEDLDYDTIAEILAVPVGTVKSRINRGREKISRKLKDEFRKSKMKEGGNEKE